MRNSSVSFKIQITNIALTTWVFSAFISVNYGCASKTIAEPLQRFRFEEVHMGAKVEMTFYADSQQSAVAAARGAFDEIAAWYRALSD